MTRQQGKKGISLFCIWIVLITCFVWLPVASALADSAEATGIDFSIKASLDPYALDQKPDRFTKGLANALSKLGLTGHAIVQNNQADIKGQISLNGLSAIDFHLTGWEERLRLTTNLFGEKPVVITPANYIRFLLKMHSYFGLPVQYIGIFTDPYSYLHGIKPALGKWTELTGGTESRSFSQEESIELATQLSEAFSESGNEAFYYWRMGLLQYVNLDELIMEFFYALPDWTADLAVDGGLAIQVSDLGETWTLGGMTVYELEQRENTTTGKVEIPDWEGYRLSGQYSLEETESGLQVFMDWKLYEDEVLYGHLTVSGQDLPDGRRMQGNGRISISFGGDGLGISKTYVAGLAWDQHQDGEKTILSGQVAFLNPDTEKKVLAVEGQISWGRTQESFQPETRDSIQGIDLFCVNDITIQTFFANAKWPAIQTAIPFLVELPAGFLNGIWKWVDESGVLVTLMDGMSE